jgi:hypothetical protein
MRYLSRIPKKIRPGRVIEHNPIAHGPNWPPGVNGFRAWTASKPHDEFVLCPCGWSGLEHYAREEFVESYREDPERYERLVRKAEVERKAEAEWACFEDA